MYKRIKRGRKREKEGEIIAGKKIYVEETHGREKLREKARKIHWDGDKE